MNHNTHKTPEEAIEAGKQELAKLLQYFPQAAELGTTEIRERYDDTLDGWVVMSCWFSSRPDDGLRGLQLRQMPSGCYLLEAEVRGLPYSSSCDKPEEAVLCLMQELQDEAHRLELIMSKLRAVAELFVEPDEEEEAA